MKKLLAIITLAAVAATQGFGYWVSSYTTTPSFNTPYTSTELNYIVLHSFSISISCTSSVSGTTSGTVYMEISEDGSTNWIEVARVSNTQSATLVLGVSLTDTKVLNMTGFVLGNYYVRLRTATTGSPTITLIKATEVAIS